ncbi:MAG: EutP/PduV family microcompartment system protein [Clostridia bacterium]|nr:EutP/PduV family microcompartment system protein [Clostridia bacterium]
MKKIIFIGRSGCGKTTLTQKIQKNPLEYKKTQYINYNDLIIDTPGEYVESNGLGTALALYSYEAEIVGLMISATDDFSLFPPNVTCMVNREVIGIVTKIDLPDAVPERAKKWLEISGCSKVFMVSSKTGYGIKELVEYLN